MRTGHRRLTIEFLERRLLLEASSSAIELFSTSPALFVENQGQWAEPSVHYAFHGLGGNIFFTDTGPIFQLFSSSPLPLDPSSPLPLGEGRVRAEGEANPSSQSPHPNPLPGGEGAMAEGEGAGVLATQFSVTFDGSNPVAPTGLGRSESLFNYFIGDQANWRSNVASYETVAYDGLYDGIDLLTWGRRDSLKYEFHVAPGADYTQIQISYAGISGLSLADDGSLHIALADGFGEMIDDAPVIYQEIAGQRVEVAGSFALVDADTYSFVVQGPYDATRELIIDPELAWSSYMGGAGSESAMGVAVDESGNVYVAGQTYSAGWVSGGYDTAFGGGCDAFVVKVTAAGAHVWSTYLGGTADDSADDIAADASGNVYLTGFTQAGGWASGGFDTDFGGVMDVFVAKLTGAGAHVWSTYLGEGGSDRAYGISLDSSGGVYVTGLTAGGWAVGGFDTSYNGGASDAFVAKLTSSGGHTWSTYLGGSDLDRGLGIALDASGGVYVTGETYSSGWLTGGFKPTFGGTTDAFAVKLTSSNGGYSWGTYLGGADTEYGYGVAVDRSGSVYVAGETYSGGWVSGGFDTVHNGGACDGFVVKLTGNGGHAWSTFLGGGDVDRAHGIVADSSDGVWLTGQTFSGGWVVGGFDLDFNGGTDDAFLMWLSADGARTWSTFLGGTSSDFGAGIAAGSGGAVYVSGWTASSGWVSGGYDTSHNGGLDAFVARIDVASGPPGSWSTYLGGDGEDVGRTTAVDAEGNIYVTGYTTSSGWASGGFDTSYNGGKDIYVAKFDPEGNPVWSTYLGGSSDDWGIGIALDGQSNVYVTGQTFSSGWVSGGFDTSLDGPSDGFVVKLSSSGAHVWSTYLGGADEDDGQGIAVDGSGNVYVTGPTSSSGWVSGGYDTSYGGWTDAYVAKLDSSGGHLWSTYLGAGDQDVGCGIAVDGAGRVFVGGFSWSDGWVSGGFDTTLNGMRDAFVAELTSAGGHVWSTYIGGGDNDFGYGLAIDNAGGVYVAGLTLSSGWTSGG